MKDRKENFFLSNSQWDHSANGIELSSSSKKYLKKSKMSIFLDNLENILVKTKVHKIWMCSS